MNVYVKQTKISICVIELLLKKHTSIIVYKI